MVILEVRWQLEKLPKLTAPEQKKNKVGMLVAFIVKTETNGDIIASNIINKVCSEVQNAQRVDKKIRWQGGLRWQKQKQLLCCAALPFQSIWPVLLRTLMLTVNQWNGKPTEKRKTNRNSILQRVDIYLAENELHNMVVLTGLLIWHCISKHRKRKAH